MYIFSKVKKQNIKPIFMIYIYIKLNLFFVYLFDLCFFYYYKIEFDIINKKINNILFT